MPDQDAHAPSAHQQPPSTGTTATAAAATADSAAVASTSAADRPRLAQRQSSTSSQVSFTQSDASSTHSHGNHRHHHHHHHPQQHKAHRNHGRLGARNTSFGHNLNKLAQLNHGHASTSKMPHDGHTTSQPGTPTTVTFAAQTARPSHARSRSGDAATPVVSPGTALARPQQHMKRNASAFVVPRNHSHSALKKNYSSGHLPRNLSGKALNKAATATAQPHRAQPKRKHSARSEKSVPASPASPVPQPTVRFALADDEADDDDDQDDENEWTEESASVSPNVTRDHTRSNSVVLEPGTLASADPHAHAQQHEGGATSGEESTSTVTFEPSARQGQQQPEDREGAGDDERRKAAAKRINGESSFQASTTRPTTTLDADAITSRLLQRRAPSPSGSDAKVTHVSALVQTDQDHRTLSHSQASTLADGTPGRDLVSRFVNANSTDGTPRDGNMIPAAAAHRQPNRDKEDGDIDASKRNKSAPNFADRGPISPASRTHQRSGSRASDLPPSRTQQKLLLQRASSALEPAKHIPAVLPRPGAAQLLGHGLSFAASEGGGTPAQIQALFAQIEREYAVVRRYRNPVADAVGRAGGIPHSLIEAGRKKTALGVGNGNTASTRGANAQKQRQSQLQLQQRRTPAGESHLDGASSPEDRVKDRRAGVKKEESRGHRSRVSFDLPGAVSAGMSVESESEERGARDEVYEICRRLWDMGDECRSTARASIQPPWTAEPLNFGLDSEDRDSGGRNRKLNLVGPMHGGVRPRAVGTDGLSHVTLFRPIHLGRPLNTRTRDAKEDNHEHQSDALTRDPLHWCGHLCEAKYISTQDYLENSQRQHTEQMSWEERMRGLKETERDNTGEVQGHKILPAFMEIFKPPIHGEREGTAEGLQEHSASNLFMVGPVNAIQDRASHSEAHFDTARNEDEDELTRRELSTEL